MISLSVVTYSTGKTLYHLFRSLQVNFVKNIRIPLNFWQNVKKTLEFWQKKCAIHVFWQGVLNATKSFQANDSDRREKKNLSVDSISKGHLKKPSVHNINGLRNQKRARSPSPLSDHSPMLLKKRQHISLDADAEDDRSMFSYWWRQHESCWIWFHDDYGWWGVDKAGERMRNGIMILRTILFVKWSIWHAQWWRPDSPSKTVGKEQNKGERMCVFHLTVSMHAEIHHCLKVRLTHYAKGPDVATKSKHTR